MTDRQRQAHEEVARMFHAKNEWHRRQAALPITEKVRILLELQRQDYPLIRRRRTMAWWEAPWLIEP